MHACTHGIPSSWSFCPCVPSVHPVVVSFSRILSFSLFQHWRTSFSPKKQERTLGWWDVHLGNHELLENCEKSLRAKERENHESSARQVHAVSSSFLYLLKLSGEAWWSLRLNVMTRTPSTHYKTSTHSKYKHACILLPFFRDKIAVWKNWNTKKEINAYIYIYICLSIGYL